jgi:hypothetical protein
MSIRYQIDTRNRLVVAWYEERFDPAEYVSFMAEIADHPDFSPDFRLLAILAQDIDLSSLSVDVMRDMQAAEAASLKRPQGALGVILVEDRMAEVVGKLYSQLAANDPDLGTDIRMVSSVAEASAHLGVSLAHLGMPEFAL